MASEGDEQHPLGSVGEVEDGAGAGAHDSLYIVGRFSGLLSLASR
jgi:hypothetical protein